MSINIQKLSKSYGKTLALNNISLTFDQTGVVGLLGPNGAGKTTLMKILTGYLNQWEGKVSIGTMDLREELKNIQQKMGYLPENNPLYLEMYVKEYLNFVGDLYGLKKAPVEEVISKTGLQEHSLKKIETLSKGYKQRVGLAATLLHNPQYLILDEPTTGLDPNQVVEIRKLIQTLGKEKLVFLSTHILQEVEAMCDQVVILNNGSVVLNQTLKALKTDDLQVVAVSFDYRVENVALQKIPHVKSVVNTFDFEYELTFETQEDMRPAVFDFAHDNGLKILNLQEKNEGLEKRFNELTKGD
ncbi:MAG: ATP-binding cassette domain-containing protein [Flavobacteriaceae bacterium]|nr:ATP-binding cassette domain-containing protein [Flavobacteriaceae bacterium]MBT6128042.1 ATP-binding cassette domain-containing protein [Flavobacteriaceae bacterium]MDG1028406.1 ATP-binding cassette domain-containing protein [Flavobacteriaceae bacterium]MDG1942599.1 ATP-binding cassette domain-containing protein [Flavobacteriaceae bacterium]